MIINILLFGCSVKYDGMSDPKLVLDSGLPSTEEPSDEETSENLVESRMENLVENLVPKELTTTMMVSF